MRQNLLPCSKFYIYSVLRTFTFLLFHSLIMSWNMVYFTFVVSCSYPNDWINLFVLMHLCFILTILRKDAVNISVCSICVREFTLLSCYGKSFTVLTVLRFSLHPLVDLSITVLFFFWFQCKKNYYILIIGDNFDFLYLFSLWKRNEICLFLRKPCKKSYMYQKLTLFKVN